jgi:protein-disulfide isomerase
VNGQTITTADIDPRVREEVDHLEERIADAPRQMLELQINTELLEVEARKRKLTSQQLYALEVSKGVTDPTEADIKAFVEANRDQLDETDPTTLRSEVISLWRADKEAKISEEFVRRLRAANPVTMGADVNTPNLNQSVVLATIAGRPITAGVIIERLKPAIYKLRLSAYEIQKEALERTISDLLLIAEANRRNVAPEDIVRTEISEKAKAPTEAEVAKFYSENKARINGDLNSVRNQLAGYLLEQERQRLERTLAERLRQGADVRVLISEPQRPYQLISADDDPSRGELTAPVTVVEFTDFQCPACAAMHPILEQVRKTYGSKVRFVVRDFPLSMHAHARKAAEAANAAHAQGKFFEYAELLFKRQNALDVPSLKKYAAELGLDRARFDAALDAGTYAAEVKHDLDDGEIYGIDSTPTIFVNGAILRNLSAEGLRAAIDHALAAPTPQKTAPN